MPEALRTKVPEAVIFEDRDVLVLGKPPGLAAHGGSGVRFGALEALGPWPEAPALALAHRLDRDTSGVLLLAKRRAALRHLQQAFRERTVQKRYLAVVAGSWPAHLKRLEALERVLASNGALVRVSGREARPDWGFRGRAAARRDLACPDSGDGAYGYGCTCPMRASYPRGEICAAGASQGAGRCPCRGWRFMPKR